jgi:hypothetical protein
LSSTPASKRAWYVVVKKSAESVRIGRFTADTLAAVARRRAAHARPRDGVVAGWRLRPFWRFS